MIEIDENGDMVGIDMGMCNTVISIGNQGRSMIIPDRSGVEQIPSYVDFKDNGSIIVGAAAKHNYSVSARNSNLVLGSKRIIGKRFDDPAVDFVRKYSSCQVENDNGFPVFKIGSTGRCVTPEEVAALIVRNALELVRERTERPISRICVTIPANFGNDERAKTLQAVMELGIAEERIEVINEPTAAAIAYTVENNVANARILVYDFGGGTFDVSIVEIVNGGIEVKKYGGDSRLGGADIDAILFEWIKELYYNSFGTPLIPDDFNEMMKRRYMQNLMAKVEECKMEFQLSATVTFSMNFISNVRPANAAQADEFSFDLTREEFNRRILHKVDKTIEVVEDVMGQYGITKDDIDRVLLVGGSSRLSLVNDRLCEIFGAEKISRQTNTDLCVAKGACLYLTQERPVNEIIAYSLDKMIDGNRVLCVIPSQTSLPAEFTVTTYTTRDYQDCVESFVLQGNQKNRMDFCPFDEHHFKKLAPYSFTGFQIKPMGSVSFDTTFKIEKNGIVYITVVEKNTGRVLLSSHKVVYNYSSVCYTKYDLCTNRLAQETDSLDSTSIR